MDNGIPTFRGMESKADLPSTITFTCTNSLTTAGLPQSAPLTLEVFSKSKSLLEHLVVRDLVLWAYGATGEQPCYKNYSEVRCFCCYLLIVVMLPGSYSRIVCMGKG